VGITRRWIVVGGVLVRAAWRLLMMFWKGEPVRERERGMWFVLALGGIGRRLVRSNVWLKGVGSGPPEPSWGVVVFVVVEDRSGRTVTYPSAGC
jgi:hypothetical protein